MKSIALILLIVSAPGVAAPSCMPSLTTIPVVGVMPASLNSGPYYAAWKCPDGTLHFNDFSLSEIAQLIPQAIAGTLTQAQAQAAYTALSTGATTPALIAYAHKVFVDQGWSAPAMLTTTVYSMIQKADQYIALPVGTAPLGTPCSTQSISGYNVIPRSSVTWYGTVKPLVVVAQCG